MAKLKPDDVKKTTPRSTDFISVASRQIAELGYDRATLRGIASELGLTSGTVFHHFRNKSDLLESIVHKGLTDGLAYVRQEVAMSSKPLARFHRVVRAHLVLVHGDMRYIHKVWTQEWSRLSEEAKERLLLLSREPRQIWSDVLDDLQKAGHLHSSPEVARHLVLPGINWTSAWVTNLRDQDEVNLTNEICAVILNWSVEEFKKRHNEEIK